jgi:coenzyme PQQ synthesis protein D (PqqD)
MENNNHQVALARQEDLVVRELPEEVMVYDLKRHKAHCLNKTAAFIWQHCDGNTNVTEMARLLQQEVGSPVDEEVIWYGLDNLGKADLLQGRVPPPAGTALSRRQVLRRLGVGAMVAIPTVVSLIAPTVAQAVTGVTVQFKVSNATCDPGGSVINPVCINNACCTGGGGGYTLCESNPNFPGPGQEPSRCGAVPCTFTDSAGSCN